MTVLLVATTKTLPIGDDFLFQCKRTANEMPPMDHQVLWVGV